MKQSSVPVLVLSARQDDAEVINQALRRAGLRARCHWDANVTNFAKSAAAGDAQLLFIADEAVEAGIADAARLRDRYLKGVPLLALRKFTDEEAMTDAMIAGAQDVVSFAQVRRLVAVAMRELRTYRLQLALSRASQSVRQYRAQAESLMAGSVDAIAEIHEGIVVNANKAWADMLGYTESADALGPVMDFIHADSHAAVKGALLACMKGRWDETALKVDVVGQDGKTIATQIGLERNTFEGEPSVTFTVACIEAEPAEAAAASEADPTIDPSTGLLNRTAFLDALTRAVGDRAATAVRALVLVRIDKFRQVQDEVGALASEEVIVQTGLQISALIGEKDTIGRVGGTTFGIIVDRGALRDIRAWAEHVNDRVSDSVLEIAGRSIAVTCTIGVAEFSSDSPYPEPLLNTAIRATTEGRRQGGNVVVVEEASDESTQIRRIDKLWVNQIKSALVDNRFRLVHLGIASMTGPSRNMTDTILRMIDQQGDEVAPNLFMPSARRNDLDRPIDRWVAGASIAYCMAHECDTLFFKLTLASARDPELVDWMTAQCRQRSVDPGRICIQISESDATTDLKAAKTLADRLRQMEFRFAIEHFGLGRDPVGLLVRLRPDYIKIDGSLLQSVATNAATQEKIKGFLGTARQTRVSTIAERVDDANTMAVLFQLGVEYMQGHSVHEPEVVLEATA